MDRSRIRKEKVADSKLSGYAWTRLVILLPPVLGLLSVTQHCTFFFVNVALRDRERARTRLSSR